MRGENFRNLGEVWGNLLVSLSIFYWMKKSFCNLLVFFLIILNFNIEVYYVVIIEINYFLLVSILVVFIFNFSFGFIDRIVGSFIK